MPVDAIQSSAPLSGGGTTGTINLGWQSPLNPANITTAGAPGTVGSVLQIGPAVGQCTWGPAGGGGATWGSVTISNAPSAAGQVPISTSTSAAAWGNPPGITALTGDVTASGSGSVAAALAAIHGAPLISPWPTPVAGEVLGFNGTDWGPVSASGTVTTVTMGGQVTGSSGAAVVAALNGVTAPAVAPTNGQVLTATGATTSAWSTPATTVTMGGQVTGPSNAAVVAAINGVTVGAAPAGAGYNLLSTSGTAAAWSQPQFSGTQNITVSGAAPTANQVLTATGANAANWATPAAAGITALTGDVSATGVGSVAATVSRLNGTVNIAATGSATVGNVLSLTAANTASWQPVAATSVTMAGNVTGPSNANILTELMGQPMGTLANGQWPTANSAWGYLNWNGANPGQWEYEPGYAEYQAISAAGTTQATATSLLPASTGFFEITGQTAGGTGVRWDLTGLPTNAVLGYNGVINIEILNSTSVSIDLYPPDGGTINGQAVNVPWPLAPNTCIPLRGFLTNRIHTVP